MRSDAFVNRLLNWVHRVHPFTPQIDRFTDGFTIYSPSFCQRSNRSLAALESDRSVFRYRCALILARRCSRLRVFQVQAALWSLTRKIAPASHQMGGPMFVGRVRRAYDEVSELLITRKRNPSFDGAPDVKCEMPKCADSQDCWSSWQSLSVRCLSSTAKTPLSCWWRFRRAKSIVVP